MEREPVGRVLLGFATGVAFGYFLNKGKAANSETIPGQLRGKDSSVLKIMLTASAVGALGTHILRHFKKTELKVKPLKLGGILGGGALFGTGMAISGYCPGTSVASLGAGQRDAVATVIGMALGAAAFVKAYPELKPTIEKGNYGEVTIPELTATSPWLWVAGISSLPLILFASERKRSSEDSK